ncbi:MAG TPA: VWA domain-containing protein [Solirubrobacteraceae bacterium]|nr:VWA domain-containing protein [Solirubrobacteraceae bacterium]
MSNSNGTKNVNPVLPRAPGTYTISFRAYSNGPSSSGTGGCSTNGSSTVTRTVTVTSPATNPTRELRCGLSVALVLDESLSINAEDVVKTRDAAKAFVAALDDTGARVAVIAFAQHARTLVPYTEVTGTTIDSTFNPGLNSYATISSTARSGTNWQSAFSAVSDLDGGIPELVVFMTDGDPNGTNSTTSFTTSLDGGADVMTPAVAAADAVKAASRVFAIGVGAAVSGVGSISRLTAVSGPHEGTDVEDSDYTTLADFQDLENKLKAIVAGLCGGSLTITKYELAPDGSRATAAGWTFTATLTPPPNHEWLTPSVGTSSSASLTTATNGEAEFHWKLTTVGDARLSVVREDSKPGFELVLAQCTVVGPNGMVSETLDRTTEPIAEGLVVPPKGHATCVVENRQKAAHLTVIKRLNPANDPGRFDLLVNGTAERMGVGNGGTTGRLTLPLGTYGVSESGAAGTDLAGYDISTICLDNGHEVASGTGPAPVSVRLENETDDIVCTITNTSTTHGNLTVEKHLVPSDNPGRFDLLIDGSPPNPGSVAVGDGGSTGPIRLPFGTYDVSESAAGGTDLSDYDTSITCIDEATGREVVSGPGSSISVTLDTADVLCTIANVHIPPPLVARLTVVKHLSPSDDPGLFNLLVDGKAWAEGVGDGGSTGPLVFELGTYKVSESAATGTNLADYDISTSCVNDGKQVVTGTGSAPVSVRLEHETDNIVCTITNTRKASPTEPGGGGEQPEICNDVVNGVPECGDVAAAPHLFVVKQMPAHARVGDRVPITITVKNVGGETAHSVVLHETPPPGGRIVAAANHGSIQSDGTVIWNLGDLVPGASRTVRATLLITATGLHTDTAVASAGNADPAFDVASVSAAPAVRPPPFTG